MEGVVGGRGTRDAGPGMGDRATACAHDDFSVPRGDAYAEFQRELAAAGLLIPMGVPGLYARGGDLECVITHFDALVSRAGAGLNPEVLRFPPVFARHHYERIDHIHNFPDLMGSVHTFTGNESEHREMLGRFERKEDWTRDLVPARVMMAPAICYPLYPSAAGSTLRPEGRRVDLQGYAFRHEPSQDPARMQSFRMHEFVRLGTPGQALEHRAHWLDLGQEIFESVGLATERVVANDPFFGRGGRVQKALQKEQALKFEFVFPVCSTEKPTAIGSCNYHQDHFGIAFDIRTPDGKPAHSACVGFGLERVALALFRRHGLALDRWPREVKDVLGL
ncbi:MAG TPA: amino acid--[acyl-carrier-protein] ligase [Usitatibacter sp.]|nr:amino acid--[acyl-carrier-protein] ligase [Usitatibacter sp.]